MAADKLKRAGYVIPEHCGICAHADTFRGDLINCEFHDDLVHPAGRCDSFKPDRDMVNLAFPTLMKKYLDKRRYTRSNRHKAKTSY